jgi:hypothetical protein
MTPVAGYTDVEAEIASASPEVRSIVMINCGGIAKLAALADVPRGVSIYVVDTHRPLHHTNVRDPKTVSGRQAAARVPRAVMTCVPQAQTIFWVAW